MNWSRHAGLRCLMWCVCVALPALPLVFGISAAHADPLRIVYPAATSATDERANYYLKLLDLALRKSGIQYELVASASPMISTRAYLQMDSNDGIDVFWGPTSSDLEQRLLPIRIPIDKGILGWRLLLINAHDRDLFAEIKTLAQLQLYSAGQQRDWIDTDILRANKLTVVTSVTYENLFLMLAGNRFQYFPRGVAEIWNEQETHANLGLEIEQHLVLHYPAHTYFFVSKNKASLGAAIEKGLHAAIGDGSFDKLFEKFNGDSIKRAHLNTRTVIELSNTLLPDNLPLRASDNLKIR